MKKIAIVSAILMIGIAALVGCKKKSSSPSYSMKATVGSTSNSFTWSYATQVGTVLQIAGFTGSGTTATFPNITLVLTNYTAPGTYTCDSLGLTTFGYYYASASSIKTSKSGSIVVTSADASTVSGTFSFTCTDGTVVSGGTFTAKKY